MTLSRESDNRAGTGAIFNREENRSDQLGRGKVGDWCDESKEKNVSRRGKSATFTGILFSPESDRKENH